ncbi:MAG: LamG-like jellyroll fold domain-containing protein [Verrucomicrobiales bacterium]
MKVHNQSLSRLLLTLQCLALSAVADATLTDSYIVSTSEFAFEITDSEDPPSVTDPASFTVTAETVVPGWQVVGGEGVIDGSITTPSLTVSSAGTVEMTLTHRYNFEGDGTAANAYDGGVVQFSINNGSFETLEADEFSSNGYFTEPIIGNNVLRDSLAFNGASPGFSDGTTIASVATIPGVSAGDTLRLRFLGGWDEGFTSDGLDWIINGVAVSVGGTVILDENFSTGDGGFTSEASAPAATWSFIEATNLVLGELVATKEGGVLTLFLPFAWIGGTEYKFSIVGKDTAGGDLTYQASIIAPTVSFAAPLDWPAAFPGPLGGQGTWGVRTYLNEGIDSAETLEAVLSFLSSADDFTPEQEPDTVIDTQENYLNFVDPSSNNIGQTWGVIACSLPFPGDALSTATNDGAARGDDHVITIAHGSISIAEESAYTFNMRGDDGFMLRITALNGEAPEFIATDGPGFVDQDARNILYYPSGTGDSNTRAVVNLMPGTYNLEYVHWEGGGGFWYQVAAAKGFFPKDEDTTTWAAIGYTTDRTTPIQYPSIVGEWTVQSTPSGVPVGSISAANASVDAAVAADSVAATSSWPQINFIDPGFGGSGRIAGDVPWPRDAVGVDDNNYAMRMTATLRIPEDGNYLFGFQGDDGSELSIGGESEAFTEIVENATGATAIGKGNTIAVNSGSLGAVANFSRETSAQFEQPGAIVGSTDTAVSTTATDGQRLGVPFLPELNRADAFTAELWVKPGAIPDGLTCVVSSGNFGDPRSGWLIYMSPGAGWNFRGYNNDGLNAAFDITGGAPPEEGEWSHLVATWNGSEAKIYVNGVLDEGAQVDGITDFVPATEAITSGRLQVGSRADNAFGWTGTVDELAIYPAELSAATILEHYSNGVDDERTQPYPELVAASAPLGYWSFNETTQPLADLNTLIADVPTGDSSSVGRIFLTAGDYPISATFWEAGGGSYFEIFGVLDTEGGCAPMQVLRTDGWPSVSDNSGLALVTNPGVKPLSLVGGLTVAEDGGLSLTFQSTAGSSYSLSFSDDLITWTEIDDGIDATGTLTTVEDLAGFVYAPNIPKRFFRIELNP